jgi:hypothetical protein
MSTPRKRVNAQLRVSLLPAAAERMASMPRPTQRRIVAALVEGAYAGIDLARLADSLDVLRKSCNSMNQAVCHAHVKRGLASEDVAAIRSAVEMIDRLCGGAS